MPSMDPYHAEKISLFLGSSLTPKEIQAAWAIMEQDFMVPEILHFSQDEAAEYAGGNDNDPEDWGAGYYGRLAAPGYLDCTDWHGPYERAWQAAASLIDAYGPDYDEIRARMEQED